jgi:hypothetical protein
MSLVSAMDDLIRKAERRAELPPQMVSVPVRGDGRIAQGWFTLAASNYHLRLDTKVEIGELPMTIRDFRSHRSLSLSVRSRLSIPAPGHKAVVAVAASPYRGKETLTNWIRDCVQATVDIREVEDLAIWISVNASSIERLVENMLVDRGFSAEIHLNTETLPSRSLLIETEGFTARPKDIDVPLSFELDVRLDHVGSAQRPPPQNETEWRKQLKAEVRDFIERNETLDRVRQFDEFRGRLQSHLDGVCRKYGWRIERFDLMIDLSEYSKTISETFDIPWRSSEGREFRFTIKAALGIAANGAALFVRAKKPDLRDWTQEQLELCIDDILFDTDTEGLNPNNFDGVQEALRQCLERKAAEVGLNVRLVITEPAVPEWDYLTPREFEVAEHEYETTSPDSKAVFSMVVTGKFATVGPAFSASRHGGNIPSKVMEVAIDAARLVMRRTEPADYFGKFLDIAPGDLRSEPVRVELEKEIKSRLVKHLAFRVESVQFTQIDPGYGEKRAALQKDGLRELSVKVLPADSHLRFRLPPGARPPQALVQFDLRGELLDPDRKYAHVLALRDFDPESLWRRVSGWAVDVLDGLTDEELSCNSFEKRQNLKNALDRDVAIKLSEFGVSIRFSSIERINTAIDSDVIDEHIQLPLDRARTDREIERAKLKQKHDYELERGTGQLEYLKTVDEARRRIGKVDIQSLQDAERTLGAIDQAREVKDQKMAGKDGDGEGDGDQFK